MASQLSDEEFQRLQTQLIELKTANYGLEEKCKKYRNDNEYLSSRLGLLEKEYQKVQKTIDRSKKAKNIDLLLSENKNLQVKLEAQEDEFRLQNQTLLQELSTLVSANEKLEQELTILRNLDGTSSAIRNSVDVEKEGQHLGDKKVLAKILAEKHEKAGQELRELRETLQESGSATLQTDLLKQAEQKLQCLETHQKNLTDALMILEDQQQAETEIKQLQEKLRRKQESLVQLQEEKEKLYTESRKVYTELQAEKDQEINMLKDQNQRLQVQLNNSQLSLKEHKEKSSQKIQELESRVSQLVKKNESTSEERFIELQAKVIELECVLGETQQEKSELERELSEARDILVDKQAWQEEKAQMIASLDEFRLLAEKRKCLVDEMSIRMQQKSDDYKHQLSNLTNEFSNREEELNKQIEALQEEVEKLSPLQSQLSDALVQVKSLEAMRGWLERRQKEAEESTESTRTYYEGLIENLKTSHCQEICQLRIFYENHAKVLQGEFENLRCEVEKKNEDLNKLEQQLHDAGEEKQLAEKKGAAVMKDLRRQLAAERKRAEKLQERMRDVLNEGAHTKTDITKSHDPETSSISSWSLMSGNCEPRESSTRENSIVAGSVSNLNGNVSPPPENQDLEQENCRLVTRIAQLQEEKWVLEEKINHLEQGSAAMAEDLMRKTALIEHYCIKKRSDPAASSSSSPSSERLSMKKIVEMLKGDEHVHESNRRMLRMLEETLTKNMHLETDLEHMSREVVRLSKGTDNTSCT
ncbi:GRIP1-associated protein 1-like [Periplaneta americana]|uniref:GRIP1-associated protein 1-like n=1 Tax=Periplaneta americana TaxID=6978 RepID=UPI0037E7FEFD